MCTKCTKLTAAMACDGRRFDEMMENLSDRKMGPKIPELKERWLGTNAPNLTLLKVGPSSQTKRVPKLKCCQLKYIKINVDKIFIKHLYVFKWKQLK
jgi:hypothetical protein